MIPKPVDESPYYSVPQRGLHWTMAFLMLGLLLAIEIKGWIPKGDARSRVVEWHREMGLMILLLLGFRVYFRWRRPAPPILPPMPFLVHRMASMAHGILYLLMLAIPILGVLFSQAKGKTVELLGWVLPIVLDEDRGLPYALNLKTAHEWLGNAMLYLVLLHVAGVIYHHWIRRDNTLIRMGFNDQDRSAPIVPETH